MLFFSQLILRSSSKISKCTDSFDECKDHTDDCSEHPGFMVLNCPVTCGTCHLRSAAVRCSPSFLNISSEPVLKTHEMNSMFSRLSTTDQFTVISREPWVLQIDNFLSDSLVDELLSQVSDWERSVESGEIDVTGAGSTITSSTRTSSTFWCNNDCYKTTPSTEINDKIQFALNMPKIHFEPIQLLKYAVGESFVPHHDYSYKELSLACGPRILTFFLYLSDVEEGGQTHFPDLNITITPKKGRAVLWPNTLSRDPSMKDTRMTHEAKAVTKGVKYAANVWVHLKEWERPSLWACTGS